ncbi:MAG: hypothetical protein ACXV7J_00190 [Methylomonas sp.]
MSVANTNIKLLEHDYFYLRDLDTSELQSLMSLNREKQHTLFWVNNEISNEIVALRKNHTDASTPRQIDDRFARMNGNKVYDEYLSLQNSLIEFFINGETDSVLVNELIGQFHS